MWSLEGKSKEAFRLACSVVILRYTFGCCLEKENLQKQIKGKSCNVLAYLFEEHVLQPKLTKAKANNCTNPVSMNVIAYQCFTGFL